MTRTLRRLALATAAAFVCSASPALASEISLGRTPAPPSAVLNDGSHALTFNADIAFLGSTPDRYTVNVVRYEPSSSDCFDPGNTQASWFTQRNVSLAGYNGSTFSTGAQNIIVPAGSQQFRYCLNVTYYQAGQALFSSRAGVAFDVAQATAAVNLVSYEDLNGDGNRQGNEPGLSGWRWQTGSPAADGVNRDTTLFTTTADGSVAIPSAITGAWTTSELLPNPNTENWQRTTPTGENFTLASGQTKNVVVGQVRPTSLCGTVFLDSNSNGRVDGNERPLSGITVSLDGRTGQGGAVGKATTSDAVGGYCFTDLLPGSYNVTETIPAEYVPTFDRDGAGNGLNYISPVVLQSGQPSANNDFGLAPRSTPPVTPPTTPTPVTPPVITPVPAASPAPPAAPQTKLCVTKKANRKTVRQNGTVVWTIRVRNCGKVTATGTVLTDPLLVDTTLGKHKGASLARGEVVWRLGTLAVGKSKTVSFTVRFDRDARVGKHINRVVASASNAPVARAAASVKVTRTVRKPQRVAVTG